MRHIKFIVATFSVLCVLSQALLLASDWPQYRGPTQDGLSPENLSLKWPASGPKVLWKSPTENGFSSFAVSGGKVFTMVGRKIENTPKEVCVAMDAATGKELWAADVDLSLYEPGGNSGAPDNSGGDGPRSTPTVSDGMVYVYTQNLVLVCLDAEKGTRIWEHDLRKENAGRNIQWKSAESAVVDGDLVFVAGGGPGQSLLAFNKKDGKLAWKNYNELITHSTPVVATILGERQIIYFLQSGLLSVSPKDGKTLWRFPFRYSTSTAISPVVSGDMVFCSAGYGVGGGACKITKEGNGFKATELWKIAGDGAGKVANHWSTPVCKDGYLYGMFSFKKYETGPMKCVEVATGKIKWEKEGFGAGNVILVNDKILALSDSGEIVSVEATPAGYKEISRAKAITGKCWSTPALSDGHLYVRSTKEGACLEIN